MRRLDFYTAGKERRPKGGIIISAEIRRATPRDIETLAQFERDICQISFGDEAVTDLDFHAKRLQKAMTQNAEGMFVCEGNGALCGWLWMDTKTNFVTQECYVNFRSFYITEDARGSAEAEALLAHGLDYCRQVKARSVVGKVHAGNVSMRALYKKMGFEATHITMEYNFALEKP